MSNPEKIQKSGSEEEAVQQKKIPQESDPVSMEDFEQRIAESEKKDAEELKRTLELIHKEYKGQEDGPKLKSAQELLGDFKDARFNEDGKIELSETDKEQAVLEIVKIKAKYCFSMPSLLAGQNTATEYDNRVGNFSTRTKIMTLEDGRRVFAVYNYPMSWIHRALDRAAKHLSGDRMAKASSSDWKRTFESRSNIPIIECEDKNVVLMPYLPNINCHDLFAHNKEIKDFGPCEFAKDIDLDGKIKIAEEIVTAVLRVHRKGKTWGETILPNIIITPEGKLIIVDPETQYDKGVPVQEQKARDIRDIIMSICGHLKYSEKIDDYEPVVDRLLSQYADKGVVEELKKVVSMKPTRINKVMRGIYETVRLGINPTEYQKVVDVILAHNAPETKD